MTKPFALDEDGQVTVVSPLGLQRFLGESDEQTESEDRTDE